MDDKETTVGFLSVTYTSFLAAGMIGFNVMNGSGIAGALIWNDNVSNAF
jgi:hypothetical protein